MRLERRKPNGPSHSPMQKNKQFAFIIGGEDLPNSKLQSSHLRGSGPMAGNMNSLDFAVDIAHYYLSVFTNPYNNRFHSSECIILDHRTS